MLQHLFLSTSHSSSILALRKWTDMSVRQVAIHWPTLLVVGNEFLSLKCYECKFSPSWVSLTSRREGASLTFVGHPSRDYVTNEISYGVDVLLYRPFFPIGMVKAESDFTVRSVKTSPG